MKAIKQGSSAKDVVITAITALEVEVTAHLNPDINEIAISMIQLEDTWHQLATFKTVFLLLIIPCVSL